MIRGRPSEGGPGRARAATFPEDSKWPRRIGPDHADSMMRSPTAIRSTLS